MSRWLRALVFVAVASSGCKSTALSPPVHTEKVRVVAVDVAPALPEAEDDEPAAAFLHRGDVVQTQRELARLAWHGQLEGSPAKRDAEVLEIKRAHRGALVYGFANDFVEATAPVTAHYCRNVPKELSFAGQRCDDVVQRLLLGGDASLAFVPCGSGKCPLARAAGATVVWTAIDGLSDLHLRKLGGRDVLIATVRWVRTTSKTGGSLLVLSPAAGLPKLGEVQLDEIDSSGPRVLNRLGAISFGPDTLSFKGTRREVEASTGKELTSAVVDETFALDGDRLVRR